MLIPTALPYRRSVISPTLVSFFQLYVCIYIYIYIQEERIYHPDEVIGVVIPPPPTKEYTLDQQLLSPNQHHQMYVYIVGGNVPRYKISCLQFVSVIPPDPSCSSNSANGVLSRSVRLVRLVRLLLVQTNVGQYYKITPQPQQFHHQYPNTHPSPKTSSFSFFRNVLFFKDSSNPIFLRGVLVMSSPPPPPLSVFVSICTGMRVSRTTQSPYVGMDASTASSSLSAAVSIKVDSSSTDRIPDEASFAGSTGLRRLRNITADPWYCCNCSCYGTSSFLCIVLL